MANNVIIPISRRRNLLSYIIFSEFTYKMIADILHTSVAAVGTWSYFEIASRINEKIPVGVLLIWDVERVG